MKPDEFVALVEREMLRYRNVKDVYVTSSNARVGLLSVDKREHGDWFTTDTGFGFTGRTNALILNENNFWGSNYGKESLILTVEYPLKVNRDTVDLTEALKSAKPQGVILCDVGNHGNFFTALFDLEKDMCSDASTCACASQQVAHINRLTRIKGMKIEEAVLTLFEAIYDRRKKEGK